MADPSSEHALEHGPERRLERATERGSDAASAGAGTGIPSATDGAPANDSSLPVMPFDGTPADRFPPTEREAEAGGLRLIMLPPGFVQFHERVTHTSMDVNLNPVRHEESWNSDRLRLHDVHADSFNFLPRGGEWRIRSNNFLPGLVMEMDPERWHAAIRESFDFDPDAVGYRSYLNDPVAADLGRAGIALLQRDLDTGERADALAIEAIGLGLLSRLAKRLADERTLPAELADAPMAAGAIGRMRLKRVTDHIEAHLGTKLTVTELAGIAGMSVSGFAGAFKGATGLPPARYITIRRVARAKGLLAYTDEPIAIIALDCGFAGQAHLTRAFKAITGLTPGAFRRMRD